MVGGGRVHDRAILDALEAFEAQTLDNTVWRIVRKGRDPLRGAIANGRWNAIGEFEALYASFDPEGALAEVGYRLSLEPVWPSRIEHEIHTLQIRADRVLRFEGLDQLEKLGVDVTRFQSFEYSATQAISAAAHFLEFEALVGPSARFKGFNLVVFLDRLQMPPELIRTEGVNWQQWRAKKRR